MDGATPIEGGGGDAPFNFALVPYHTSEELLENVRSSVRRGLPEVRESQRHDAILSVAGGGPSLEDTWRELEGCIAAVNGSLGYLLSKNITPHLCGVCHPTIDVLDSITPHQDVTYFVASHCHPAVFDKLKDCKVFLWHNHPVEGLDDLLTELYPQGWLQVPGGCSMGLRWINLGYLNGFRKFHLHGLDSSFRDKSTHAYPDKQDDKEWITFDGFKTRLNFLGQVSDFITLMGEIRKPDIDPTEIKMFGDGLLQKRYRTWLAAL